MKETAIVYGAAAAIAAFFAFLLWWNVSLWSECRETNSFFYCVRILGR